MSNSEQVTEGVEKYKHCFRHIVPQSKMHVISPSVAYSGDSSLVRWSLNLDKLQPNKKASGCVLLKQIRNIADGAFNLEIITKKARKNPCLFICFLNIPISTIKVLIDNKTSYSANCWALVKYLNSFLL